MTVCYFGIYDREYARNKNIIKGLCKAGIEVIEVADTTPGPRKFARLFQKHRALRGGYDLMIVGFPGQIIVPFARLITRKPVVFDLHASYFDSIVRERKTARPYSLSALYFYLLDWLACRMATKVLLDTKTHVEYLSRLLRIRKSKFIVVYHGIDDELFVPREVADKPQGSPFIVSFHGYIQRLNGMDLVIRAFERLRERNVQLWIIGGGSEYSKMQHLAQDLQLTNVLFFPPLPPPELISKLRVADLGLGFFSEAGKIDRVIANKVYELMALKIPVLTGESRAMQEQFEGKREVFYCRRGDVQAIAGAIVEIMENPPLRKKVGEEAYSYVITHLTLKQLGENLAPELHKLIR